MTLPSRLAHEQGRAFPGDQGRRVMRRQDGAFSRQVIETKRLVHTCLSLGFVAVRKAHAAHGHGRVAVLAAIGRIAVKELGGIPFRRLFPTSVAIVVVEGKAVLVEHAPVVVAGRELVAGFAHHGKALGADKVAQGALDRCTVRVGLGRVGGLEENFAVVTIGGGQSSCGRVVGRLTTCLGGRLGRATAGLTIRLGDARNGTRERPDAGNHL